ncbi:MAG TPA: ABC transporter ATP-binding protein [Prolixibacteraceae bacterium]|nr:ABC transporter ATP-binding protein [Prolixibacteraceae bacterium]
MNNAIECNNLTHYYGSKRIVENLNFQVKEGTILGLLGKNGTGKTTVFNILNGFLRPTDGKCLIFGEDTQCLSPATKSRIGFLIEGHVQYSFMNVKQIEKFYSGFYPKWKPGSFWEIVKKLDVSKNQKISTMSWGQRSQVALGIILAQDPDLLILDDFSMGLDPGYRRLFVDHLREYAKSENKTIFTTSHIIQDMERLIDDVLIIDFNKVMVQSSVSDFLSNFKRFDFELENDDVELDNETLIVNIEKVRNKVELYTYSSERDIRNYLAERSVTPINFSQVTMNLEDAFIGLTRKY